MKKLGQLLSAIIYKNITIIIAVGIIHEIFGIYGWWYNDRILLLVNPIYNTLLPILFGYTGGKLIGGQRGAVVAAIVTYGLTLSSSTPAILGAMMIGPLTGWMIKKFDEFVKRKLPGVGYELLLGNVFAAGIASVLTIICFLYVGQSLSIGMEWSTKLLETVINSGWLPLASAIIEPAKVLFFNNIINFGILGPLGIQQVKEIGKSIFFLLESNPGPGLGILLAYWLKTKTEQRKGAKLAAVIHFFGGIHEVYFPYVLMKPLLILPLVLSGMAGVFTFQLFDVGLVALPSPGSILLFIGLAPREDMLFILLGVILSALISFLFSILLLKQVSDSPTEMDNRETILEFYHLERDEQLIKSEMKDSSLKREITEPEDSFIGRRKVETIFFVCEAGIGSSAMGASMLRKKLDQANMTIEVGNSSINEIPSDADLVICHQKLLSTVQNAVPEKICYPLKSFTDMKGYDELLNQLKDGAKFH